MSQQVERKNMSTSQIFSMMQDEFSKAQADQGLGSLGEWPPAGIHECYILKMNMDESSSFRQSSDSQEFPSVTMQYEYQLTDDPDRATPLTWIGAPFNLIKDHSNLTHEGSKIRNRIEMERFKGHLKTILGYEPTNLETAINEVNEKLSGENAVVVNVRCDYNTRGNRTYKTEKLQSLVSN
jgi:hypothetical protein